MKQFFLNLSLSIRKTRRQVFLDQMDQIVPSAALVELIAPYYSESRTGRPPFSLSTMLRIHLQSSNGPRCRTPSLKKPSLTPALYREFAQLEEFGRLPDESTILQFRHRLEKHKLAEQILATVNNLLIERGLLLKAGTVVDATLIAALSSIKNKDKNATPTCIPAKKAISGISA